MAGNIPTAATLQLSQLGVETSYGVEVPATIQLRSVSIRDSIKLSSERFKAAGSKLHDVVVYGLENAELSFEGMATYDELGYFCRSIPLAAATSVPSYTVERGGSNGGKTYPGCLIEQWTLRGDVRGVRLEGRMFSSSHNDHGPTPLQQPPAPTPIENAHVTIKLDTVTVQRWFEWELALTNLWAGCQYGGSNSMGGANEGDMSGTFSLKLEADSDNLAEMQERDSRTLEIIMTNGLRTWRIRCNIKLDEVLPFEAQGQVYAYGLRFALLNTAVSGTANVLDVANN